MSSRLVRDGEKVTARLVEMPNGQLITTHPCRIQIPHRFEQRNLAQVSIDTYIYGIFAIIFEDNIYGVFNINAMIKISPSKVLTTTIDDTLYYEFYFDANEVVIDNLNVVKRDTLIYNVFDEFVFQGNIPWYMGYTDVGKLFDTAESHAGSRVSKNLEIIELIASMISRNRKNRTQYYRTCVETYSDLKTNPPDYVPLKSVYYSASNTLNKIAGSYFNDGIVSALVTPCHEVEKVEALLRS